MKTWIKTNFQKIALSFAVITGSTGLILGAVAYYQTNGLTKYLDHFYEEHRGGAIIWEHKRNDKYKIELYFGVNPKNQDDIKWDGKYPDGYFYK
ncbi:hypothetical protein [Spiroplasma endosymbiont of Amphimallon solstitiale]|uniref:hypothetical protein n=1 Tax=Spiroplasma endosymbiont of Amphimallon solstitiale TaxID=3066288 RepID=UPI00313C0BAB